MATDWERAGLVVDALWGACPSGTICADHEADDTVTVTFAGGPAFAGIAGRGPTYVAALIDLGRRWDATSEVPESTESAEHGA